MMALWGGSSELYPALFLDAFERSSSDIRFWVRHRDGAGLGRVAELFVAALLANLKPSIGFDFLDDLAATRACYRHNVYRYTPPAAQELSTHPYTSTEA
jgi:hypothetical protein